MRRGGFTLVEMVLVIVLTLILTSAAIHGLRGIGSWRAAAAVTFNNEAMITVLAGSGLSKVSWPRNHPVQVFPGTLGKDRKGSVDTPREEPRISVERRWLEEC